MAKMTAALAEKPLSNLRVYDDDATRLLDWLPEASLEGIDLLYPDPWPKKKHWKRRFVSPANLDRFARVLKTGEDSASRPISTATSTGRCCLAGAWRLRVAGKRGGATGTRPYEGWPGTRYEAKAIREGRRPAYLTFCGV